MASAIVVAASLFQKRVYLGAVADRFPQSLA